MNTFKSFFLLELKRRWTWQTLVVFVIILGLSFYFTYMGVQHYVGINNTKLEFQEIEKLKVELFSNYLQYGGYGFRLLFIPSSTNIFFYNTGLFLDLTAQIDVGERLNIYNSFKGENFFTEKPGKLVDFSGIILILGSLIALLYGYDSLRHREYLKLLTSLCGHRRVFSFILLPRIIILYVSFFIIAVFTFLFGKFLLMINGFDLPPQVFSFFALFLGMMFLMLLFFFSIGISFGIMTFKYKEFLMIFFIVFTWIASIYFIPVLLNKIVETQTSFLTSNFQAEYDKLKKIMDFEDWVSEQEKKKNPPTDDEFAAAHIKSIKEMLSLEEKRNADIMPYIDRLQIFSMFYPSTFYLSVNREIGSCGYQGIKDFSQNALTTKEKFIINFYNPKRTEEYEMAIQKRVKQFEKAVEKRLAQRQNRTKKDGIPGTSSAQPKDLRDKMKPDSRIDKEAKEKSQNESKTPPGAAAPEKKRIPKVESFIKGDDNLFAAESQLPVNSWFGVLMTFIYIFICSFLSFLLLKKSVFYITREKKGKKKNEGFADFEIELQGGRCEVVLSRGKALKDHFYNLFSGRNKGFEGKVALNKRDVVKNAGKHNFLYICQPEEIPGDIKARDLISFMASLTNTPGRKLTYILKRFDQLDLEKTFGDLEEEDKARVLLAAVLLKKSETFMFHEFAKGMPANLLRIFRRRLQRLKEKNACIIYFTNDVLQGRKVGDFVSLLKRDAELMSIDL